MHRYSCSYIRFYSHACFSPTLGRLTPNLFRRRSGSRSRLTQGSGRESRPASAIPHASDISRSGPLPAEEPVRSHTARPRGWVQKARESARSISRGGSRSRQASRQESQHSVVDTSEQEPTEVLSSVGGDTGGGQVPSQLQAGADGGSGILLRQTLRGPPIRVIGSTEDPAAGPLTTGENHSRLAQPGRLSRPVSASPRLPITGHPAPVITHAPAADTAEVNPGAQDDRTSRGTGARRRSRVRRLSGRLRPRRSSGRRHEEGSPIQPTERELSNEPDENAQPERFPNCEFLLRIAGTFRLTPGLGSDIEAVRIKSLMASILIAGAEHIDSRRSAVPGEGIYSPGMSAVFNHCSTYASQGDNLRSCSRGAAKLYFARYIGHEDGENVPAALDNWEPNTLAKKMDYKRIQYVIKNAFPPGAAKPSILGKGYCYLLDFIEWIFRVVTFSDPTEFSNVKAHNLLSCLISIRDSALPAQGNEQHAGRQAIGHGAV